MPDFVIQYWVEFFFTGIVAVFAFFIKYTIAHLKVDYLDTINQNKEELVNLNRKIDAVREEHSESVVLLENRIGELKESSDANDLALIREMLFRLMREGIAQEHVTLTDFETASELFDRYSKLGGNGAVHSLYDAYKKLPIHEDDDTPCGCVKISKEESKLLKKLRKGMVK